MPAPATTVTLSYTGAGPFGAPNLQEQVDILYTGAPGVSLNNVRSGAFSVTDGTNSFLAWCFDIFAFLDNDVEYTVTDPADTMDPTITADRDSLLNRLFSSQFADVDTAEEGAAFQLAIWEIVNEDPNGTLGLGDGLFTASDNAGAISLANTYLMNLGGAEDYDLTYYVSGTNQDLMAGTLAPVPLPAGVLFLMGGLGALGLMRRRST